MYLQHHGIKGQKWGVRRYQNPDGSYTEAGKKRYAIKDSMQARALYYGDRRKEEKRKLLKQYGGQHKLNKAMKKEIEITGQRDLYKNAFGGIDIQGVSKYLDRKLNENTLKTYNDLDKATRDYYAYQTKKALNEQALAVASFLTIGIGTSETTSSINRKKAMYEYYDKVVKQKGD